MTIVQARTFGLRGRIPRALISGLVFFCSLELTENMKTIRYSFLSFVVLLFAVPMLCAQDFSKYRGFAIGTRLADVLKHADKNLLDINVTHAGSPLLPELTWWPPTLPSASYQPDSVERVLFSFYNGELYKMSVTYDQAATEGMTVADMVKLVSAKNGSPTSITPEADPNLSVGYDSEDKPVASWSDAQYSFNLVRSSFSDHFGFLIYSKRVNAEVELAIVEAAKLAKLDRPAKEADRQKKQTDDLEVARQKNLKQFRPSAARPSVDLYPHL